MIKKLFVLATLLFAGCASRIECIDNKSVAAELASVIKSGHWNVRVHIEPIENGAYAVSTEMQKNIDVAPNQINYVHNAEYLEKNAIEPMITRLVFSSKTFVVRYIRQLISYDAITRTANWNEKCLDKTRIKK